MNMTIQAEFSIVEKNIPQKSALNRILSPLEQIAGNSDNLLSKPFGKFERDGQTYSLPRYIYLGEIGRAHV